MSFAKGLFAIRTKRFVWQECAASDNKFMQGDAKNDDYYTEMAKKEFSNFESNIIKNKIPLIVFDQADPDATDAVYPDWFTTHKNADIPDGVFILYPILLEHRRKERDERVINYLKENFKYMIDLTYFEKENKALEGKGAVVWDHRN